MAEELVEQKELSKEELEKKKSHFRLFWLFVGLDVALFILIVVMVVQIFVKSIG
ncbi:MAG: hypothetical protein IJ656_02140 [Bacilli bacterium]|nr:hypothetical protein [Bacilli bacterium]